MFLILTALAIAAGASLAVYTLGPYIWGYCTGGLLRKGKERGGDVALTFDDGPDPRYTPRCLEILKAHRIHATFFLIGQKVRMYPELVREICDQGHDVGNHTWSHQQHWLIGPVRAMREVRDSAGEIAGIAGHAVRYFRPAYGVMNLFTYLEARRLRQRCVLWSASGNDWEGGTGGRSAAAITAAITASLGSGEIILLHDSGGAEGAPETMLEALPEIIAEAKRRGLQPVSLSEMNGEKEAGT